MDYKAERRERTRQEQMAGRNATYTNMITGLLEQLQSELDPGYAYRFDILKVGGDWRQWKISASRDGQVFHTEPFWDFPSDELKAKLLLIGA